MTLHDSGARIHFVWLTASPTRLHHFSEASFTCWLNDNTLCCCTVRKLASRFMFVFCDRRAGINVHTLPGWVVLCTHCVIVSVCRGRIIKYCENTWQQHQQQQQHKKRSSPHTHTLTRRIAMTNIKAISYNVSEAGAHTDKPCLHHANGLIRCG